MANINKIRLSGTTYNIEDSNAPKTVELTQAQYDALVSGGTVDPNTFYIITDAQGADLSNYYTKSETSGATEISTALASKADTATTYTKTEVDNAITAATSIKQDTLVSGTNIKTINNESLLGSGNITIQGGGGKAIEAGRGISVTTGETADTVSFNLPISGGTNALGSVNGLIMGESTLARANCSFAMGSNTLADGYRSFAGGVASRARAEATFAYGVYVDSLNYNETAFGIYNVSNSNILFSVGNGTANNARHNAFEIRQNGDIYCSDGTNDVKLQDTITATAANTTALGGLKLVKLTQSEYDALSPDYDSNTLYIIKD